MRLAVFGLSITSSWGNGHATLWRGLVRALVRRGCRVSFFERDEPYYAANRDLTEIPGAEIVLYDDWDEVKTRTQAAVCEADASIVTSYCPWGSFRFILFRLGFLGNGTISILPPLALIFSAAAFAAQV